MMKLNFFFIRRNVNLRSSIFLQLNISPVDTILKVFNHLCCSHFITLRPQKIDKRTDIVENSKPFSVCLTTKLNKSIVIANHATAMDMKENEI